MDIVRSTPDSEKGCEIQQHCPSVQGKVMALIRHFDGAIPWCGNHAPAVAGTNVTWVTSARGVLLKAIPISVCESLQDLDILTVKTKLECHQTAEGVLSGLGAFDSTAPLHLAATTCKCSKECT